MVSLLNVHIHTQTHTHTQTSSPVNAAPPVGMELPALTMAMVDTDADVLLAILGLIARPTLMTAAQIPVTVEGPAL